MKSVGRRFLSHPIVAATTASCGRFTRRHGFQHAAAVTYFSVLTLIPVVMLAGAGAGFTLTVLRPDWLVMVQRTIAEALGESALSDIVITTFNRALAQWHGLLGVALLTAAYSGMSWVANLRIGFHAMIKTASAPKKPWWRAMARHLADFSMLFALLLAAVAVIGVTAMWLHDAGFLGWLVRTIVTLALGWALMALLYLRLPLTAIAPEVWLPGSIVGALAITIVQQCTSWLVPLFSYNPVALVFGPIIAAMILFNLLAIIVLLCFAATGERLAGQASRPE